VIGAPAAVPAPAGRSSSLARALRGGGLARRERRLAIALLVPSFVGLVAVMGYPTVQTILWSFEHADVLNPQSGYTFSNYTGLWHDPVFWAALRFTVIYAAMSVAGQMLLGLGIAVMANREFRGRWLFRALLIFPWMMPTVITAVVWQFMYDPNYGLFDAVLQRAGLPHSFVFLGSSKLAIFSLLMLAIWKVNSFAALVFLAGMQGISPELYEAAEIDGAAAWQRFRRVTLPMLKPTILVVLVLRTVEALQAFDIIYGLTGGGPGGATQNLPMYLYQQGILGLNFGYGSAVGVVLAVIIAAFAVLYLKVLYQPSVE